jgi:hypothetical protein
MGMKAEELTILKNKVLLVGRLLRSLALFFADEYRRGTLRQNLRAIVKARGISIAVDMSHADLLEEKAVRPELANKPFLYFQDQVLSYRQMD